MEAFMDGFRTVIFLGFVALASLATAQTSTERIRGDVVRLEGNILQVKTRAGDALTIKLADNFAVSAIVKRDLAAVVPGAFVGAATMPNPDGTLRALEVLVFPEAARGSGEGHYPWDLQPGSMMTNATVSDVVAIDAARRMTLRYKDGEKVVVVPPDAPIVTFEPGDPAMLVPGARVILGAVRQTDGTLTAARISVGKDGLVPPM
jgi:hypothetical protein